MHFVAHAAVAIDTIAAIKGPYHKSIYRIA